MIEKDTLLKAISATALCFVIGLLYALAPATEPFMKSFFAFNSLVFLSAAALSLPSLKKHHFYWGMLIVWSVLQSYILFSWVIHFPLATALAWAVTPLAYTTISSLVVVAIHKSIALTPRQRMLFIMSAFLGGMHLILGDTFAMKSVIVYFVALVVFPINFYELFHEPSEAGARLGHNLTTTLLGFTLSFYLLDCIGTAILSIDGLRFLSMYDLFEKGTIPLISTTIAYGGTLASVMLLAYLIWAILPRACCARQSHEDIF